MDQRNYITDIYVRVYLKSYIACYRESSGKSLLFCSVM